MKKLQKSTLILMMIIIPIIILIVSLMITGISVKEFPWWAIIGIPALIFITPFTVLLTQSKIQNTPLEKRRKGLLILMGAFTVFLLFIAIICYMNGISFLQVLLTNLVSLVGLIAIFLYVFFRKDKEQKSLDDSK